MATTHETPGRPGVVVTFVDCEATSFSGYCSEVGIAQVWRGKPHAPPTANVFAHPDYDDIYILSDSRLVRVDAWLDDYLKWDAGAEKVTGISRELLREQGRPAREVADWLNGQLTGLTPYSDASHFDRRWIDQVFRVSGTKRRFDIWQMERLTKRWDVDTQAFFQHCKAEYNNLHGDAKPHRAAADAISWANIFLSCWREDLVNTPSLKKIFSLWWA